MTRTNAGNTPANNAVGPSSRSKVRSVDIVEGDLFDFEDPESDCVAGGGKVPEDEGEDEGELCLAVIRVFTTQMGFVMKTVAEPAIAPANIDSKVVRFLLALEVRIAARMKKERVHSYPESTLFSTDFVKERGKRIMSCCSFEQVCQRRTIVVDEIRDADAKKCTVQPRIQPRDAFSLDDSTYGIVGG